MNTLKTTYTNSSTTVKKWLKKFIYFYKFKYSQI